MDCLTEVSTLIAVKRGEKAFCTGQYLLNKENKSPFEAEAAKAFKRTAIGSIILVGLMLIVTIVVTFAFLPDIGSGVTRIGRIEDGKIRYIQNEVTYVEPKDVGLSAFDLSENDKVTLYFDSVTDEITEAYPTEYVEKYQNFGFSIVIGNLVAWIVILLFYCCVICRMTPFGRPWTEYCMKLKQKEPKLSAKTNLVLSCVALLIAVFLALPQLTELVGNMQRMQDIDRQKTIIQQGLAAGEAAKEMTENLEHMQTDDVDMQDINEAMERIRQLLDEE